MQTVIFLPLLALVSRELIKWNTRPNCSHMSDEEGSAPGSWCVCRRSGCYRFTESWNGLGRKGPLKVT